MVNILSYRTFLIGILMKMKQFFIWCTFHCFIHIKECNLLQWSGNCHTACPSCNFNKTSSL